MLVIKVCVRIHMCISSCTLPYHLFVRASVLLYAIKNNENMGGGA